MNGLFSPDSRFMRYMTRFADLMILNLLFFLTSIPIVTIGASWTALYTVCFQLGTVREGSTFRNYFRAFRENFGQATKLWLLGLAWGLGTGACALLFYAMSGWMHYFFILFAALFAVVVLMFGYVFPLQSRFENSIKSTLKNALLLCLGYLPRSIVMGVLNMFPFIMLATDYLTFWKAAFAWVFIWFAAAAYADTLLLKKVFAPYLKEEENDRAQDEA